MRRPNKIRIKVVSALKLNKVGISEENVAVLWVRNPEEKQSFRGTEALHSKRYHESQMQSVLVQRFSRGALLEI